MGGTYRPNNHFKMDLSFFLCMFLAVLVYSAEPLNVAGDQIAKRPDEETRVPLQQDEEEHKILDYGSAVNPYALDYLQSVGYNPGFMFKRDNEQVDPNFYPNENMENSGNYYGYAYYPFHHFDFGKKSKDDYMEAVYQPYSFFHGYKRSPLSGIRSREFQKNFGSQFPARTRQGAEQRVFNWKINPRKTESRFHNQGFGSEMTFPGF